MTHIADSLDPESLELLLYFGFQVLIVLPGWISYSTHFGRGTVLISSYLVGSSQDPLMESITGYGNVGS